MKEYKLDDVGRMPSERARSSFVSGRPTSNVIIPRRPMQVQGGGNAAPNRRSVLKAVGQKGVPPPERD